MSCVETEACLCSVTLATKPKPVSEDCKCTWTAGSVMPPAAKQQKRVEIVKWPFTAAKNCVKLSDVFVSGTKFVFDPEHYVVLAAHFNARRVVGLKKRVHRPEDLDMEKSVWRSFPKEEEVSSQPAIWVIMARNHENNPKYMIMSDAHHDAFPAGKDEYLIPTKQLHVEIYNGTQVREVKNAYGDGTTAADHTQAVPGAGAASSSSGVSSRQQTLQGLKREKPTFGTPIGPADTKPGPRLDRVLRSRSSDEAPTLEDEARRTETTPTISVASGLLR